MSYLTAIGIIVGTIASYLIATTPEQREMHAIGLTIYGNQVKRLMGAEQDPLIDSVEISLYYKTHSGKEQVTNICVTREFIRLLKSNQSNQLQVESIEKLIHI